ncbi:hypothetical protein ABIF94_002496 [Bradyrhizobium ottawaense]|uniref:hypothetical protein n=1 Tax=Bradyrhizobium ottawaense TaxID=931866 RepID=UPI003833793E
MAYQVRLRSLVERQAAIRAAVQASSQTRDFYDFRSQKTQLPFVRLPEDMLIYRMENFRTYTSQREYLARERKAADFFLSGQETESIQQLQHEILSRLARKGISDSVVPVIKVLAVDKQREPLLITSAGAVVNGNRRLAAMRELFIEDSQTYSAFSHVDCLVLPSDATASEIVDIEAALQAKPETRLDYDWIGDCQLIQKLLETHNNVEQVATRLNRKEAEVRNSIAALKEAELYLRDWVRAEAEFSRVEDAEQLFKDLPKNLSDKSPELADGSRLIAWTLLDNKGKINERLYNFNSTFGKRAEDVLNRVASDLNISLRPSRAEADEDGFDIDLGDGEPTASYKPLIEAFKDPRRKEETFEALIDVCRSVVETEKGIKGGSAALKIVAGINSRLKDVDIGASDPATHKEIDRHLREIVNKISGLQSILSRLRQSDT